MGKLKITDIYQYDQSMDIRRGFHVNFVYIRMKISSVQFSSLKSVLANAVLIIVVFLSIIIINKGEEEMEV